MTKSVMERSHAKLTQWAASFCLYAASKKDFTTMQLQRHLGCEYNTAWFLHHRAVAVSIFPRWAVPALLSRLMRLITAIPTFACA